MVGGGLVQQRAYTYHADGHRLSILDHLSGSRRFDLDLVGRVTAVHAANWTETYAHDEANNQTQATCPLDHPGHYRGSTRSALTSMIWMRVISCRLPWAH